MILIDPAVRFGRPSVGGVSTSAVAGMVMGGTPVDVTATEYGLSRHQVLLACWHEGLQGEYRREWSGWAAEAHQILGGWVKPFDLASIPDPPERVRSTSPNPSC